MGQQLITLNGLRWTGDDLQKKFSDSFVRATVLNSKSNKKISDNGLVYISNPYMMIDLDDPMKILVEGKAFTAPNVWQNFAVPQKDFLLEEDRPQPCISNCTYRQVDAESGKLAEVSSAFMFSYNPARQWKRGFNASNGYLFIPTRDGFGNLQLEAKYALNVLTPVHQPLGASLEEMRKDKKIKARAISNRYWLIRQGDAIALYSKKAPLGNFLGERLFVGDGARLLRHEISKELPEVRMNYG
jgi:hypothetical protein